MNHSPKTIAIKGAYGCGNFGDDALMRAAYEITRKAFDTETIGFLCNESNYIRKIIPNVNVFFPTSRFEEIADIIIYGGGTQFFSFPLTSQRGFRSFLRRIVNNLRKPEYLWQKVIRLIIKINQMPFRATKQRVAAIGIGLGPFVENCSNLLRIKKLFTRMDYIAVRETQSYDLCKNWGCNNLSLSADLCYMPDLWKEDEFSLHTDIMTGEIRRIGVITRDWPHTYEGDSYADSLFRVVDELRLAGKKVDFISFAEKTDTEWGKRLESRGEQFIAWDPEHSSISSFLKLLSSYDSFITARFHGAIFASILGKPVVCIEVEQKLRLVSDLFSSGARLWAYPFSVSECLKHISDLEATYSHSVECLARVVNEQGVLVEKMIENLRQMSIRSNQQGK